MLNKYRAPSALRSVVEIGITVVPFLLLWVAAWFSLRWSYAFSLLFGILASGFLVRLFMIQHDCGHGALFSATAGQRLGRARYERPHFHPV
jgi:omega-6 fatty acid desaturase (delta-12 desaturase)